MKKIFCLVPLAVAAAALLSACGKPNDATPAAATTPPVAASSGSTAPTLGRRAAGDRRYAFIDMSWESLPQAEFQKVKEQVRDLYWSGAESKPERLAEDFSPAYRRETDTFKKVDLQKSLASELDQHYAHAQTTKDYAVRSEKSSASIQPYDAATGGFKVGFNADLEREGVGMKKDEDRSVNNTSWFIRFLGVPYGKELFYKPKDEAEARAIESVLAAQRGASGREVAVDILASGYVAGTLTPPNKFSDIAVFAVDTVGMVDKKSGKTLFTFDAKQLGPIQPGCKSTREALKMPEPKVVEVGMSGMDSRPPQDC